jgi:hypothetical protein
LRASSENWGRTSPKEIVDEETRGLTPDERKELADTLEQNAKDLEEAGATPGGDTPIDRQLDQTNGAAAAAR